MRKLRPAVLLLAGLVPVVLGGTTPSGKKQIIIQVRRTERGLRYELDSKGEFQKHDANYLLAELELRSGNEAQVIEIVDDRAPLSALTEVSEMVVNAGFKDIRPFIYWHKTGRMAEVQFGPVIKFTMKPGKLEQRLEKAQ